MGNSNKNKSNEKSVNSTKDYTGITNGVDAQYQAYYPQQSANASYYDPSYYQSYTNSYMDYNYGAAAMQQMDAPVTAIPLGYDQGSYQPPQDSKEKKTQKKKTLRVAAGKVWEDRTMLDWDPNDFRLFVGDLGTEVNDEMLRKAFEKYPSLVKAKVIRDKRSDRSKGYGFVSFKETNDFVKAWKEMNGKYVGNRPIKLRKSTWKERSLEQIKKKNKPY